MPPEVLVALIGAGASLILAIWSLVTAKLAKGLALAAEERAKRGEIVRVKSLEAIDGVLSSAAELKNAMGNLLFLQRSGFALSIDNPEIQKQLAKFSEHREILVRVSTTAAPYLSELLINEIKSIISKTERLDFCKINEIIGDLELFIEDISKHAREKYLQ